ncbi:MAG: Wzz/FepE/Etk N-terminal domain-containing protein [Rikenellaceae bacterium]
MEQQKFQEEEEIDLIELAMSLWAERVKIIKYGVIAGVIGIIVAFSIPKVYTSSVKMVPEMETQSSGGGSMGALASLAGINLGGESVGITAMTYPQIVSSTPFIFEFASMPVQVEDGKDAAGEEIFREVTLIEYFTEEYKSPWWSVITGAPMKALGAVLSLFKEKEEEEGDINDINLKALSKDQDDYRKMFAESVSLSIDQKTFEAALNVNTQSAEVSLMLADSILVRLQEYMTLYKTSKTRSELYSNQNMLAEAQKNYYRADSVYAAAVDRNRNVTSSVAQINIDRLMNEKNLTYQIYSQIAAQVELNRTKLNAETPILTIIEPASMAIKAASPNKPMIVIAFGFLGGVVAVVPIIFAQLMAKKEDEDDTKSESQVVA